MNFDVISDCENEDPNGLERDLYLVCACDVADPFPQPPTTGTQGATMVVTGDIILNPLKAFNKLRIIMDSGENTDEKKSKIYEQGFKAKTVSEVNYDEFFNQYKSGGCFIGILVEKSGKKRLLGHPTKGPLTLSTAKRTNNSEISEWEFTMTATPGNVSYIYEGDIDLDPLT